MLLFDLDETLYPRATGVVPRIDLRINRYLEEKLGIHAGEVDRIRRGWWAEFGTTLAGLQAHHSIDPDDYLHFIHDIELDDLLARDEALLELLTELPKRKAVFTNASRRHAARVLERLGIASAFEAVVALEDLGYVPKPGAAAFARVLERTAARAADSTLIDDNRSNLVAAKALGMRTVWVDSLATASWTAEFDHPPGFARPPEGVIDHPPGFARPPEGVIFVAGDRSGGSLAEVADVRITSIYDIRGVV